MFYCLVLGLDPILYGGCATLFAELPLCWIAWGIIGRLKRGKPDGFYEQKISIMFDKFQLMFFAGKNTQNSLFIPSGKWSSFREVK